ncbi:MAG: Bax inhibitor-1/YccA family protein [bacterium]|nr:Bax inhibitor-1/YccA family protein [bacterium]
MASNNTLNDKLADDTGAPSTVQDAGLRAYMLRIYNYMVGGLALTGGVAFLTAQTPELLNAMYSVGSDQAVAMKPLGWVIMLAPLGVVIYLSFGLKSMSLGAAQLSFWAYAILIGLSLAVIFLGYAGADIARVFFITAVTFAGMSLYGYATRRDLTSLGSFLFVGLFGIIIASLVNMFLQSSAMQFALSVLGVVVFVGLTAFDTQKLKRLYAEMGSDGEWASKVAVMGALTLYLDFLNIFLFLLRLMGNRKN